LIDLIKRSFCCFLFCKHLFINELRKINTVEVIEIHSNLGEIRYFEFTDTQSAIEFLEDFSIDEILDHANSFTLFDKPSVEE
jgi:hypothetical protein